MKDKMKVVIYYEIYINVNLHFAIETNLSNYYICFVCVILRVFLCVIKFKGVLNPAI